jgi:hypothetical protein
LAASKTESVLYSAARHLETIAISETRYSHLRSLAIRGERKDRVTIERVNVIMEKRFFI